MHYAVGRTALHDPLNGLLYSALSPRSLKKKEETDGEKKKKKNSKTEPEDIN
jgi:hypothetical protein